MTAGVTKQRIVMVGSTAVGKTAIVNKYIYGSSPLSDHQPTVGIDFFSKFIKIRGETVQLQLWDTAGQEKFHSLIPSYLRNATVAIIVYDVTYRESFDRLDYWYEFTLNQTNPAVFIVGNKTDLEGAREVTSEEGRKWAEAHVAQFIETSAQTGENIPELFQRVATATPPKPEISPDQSEIRLEGALAKPPAGGCC
jgi:Ras-related protein Rab-6A